MIDTARLTLIPATGPLVQAEIEGRDTFSQFLEAIVPENWPPELLADALALFLEKLEHHPEMAGWLSWYWVLREKERILVGCGGFKGPPRPDGSVEIGYSVLPQYQRCGYASEAIGGLVDWAFAHGKVSYVIAETAPENKPSIRLLEKLGFRAVGGNARQFGIRFFYGQREAVSSS